VFCTFVCLPFSVGNWKVTRLSEGDLREREREREREIHGKVRDGRIYLYSTKKN
jgi:hypothetical protein